MARTERDRRAVSASPASVDFEQFFTSEYRGVVAVSLALVGSRPVAEDVAQDAFLAALRHWGRISSYDEPGAWVRRVAINNATSVSRRWRRDVNVLARLVGRHQLAIEPELPDDDLWRVVRRLPRRQAQCVVLRYVEDLTARQIARVIGVAESTVRVHLHEARRALAVLLPDERGQRDA